MKNIIISLFVCLLTFMSSIKMRGQNYSDLITDNNYNYYRDSLVANFCQYLADYNGDTTRFFTYSIVYLTPTYDGGNATYIEKDINIIDTSAFTRNFFCSGQFITDYIQKVISKGWSYKFVYKDYLYDRNNKRCYDFNIKYWDSIDKGDSLLNPNSYLYEAFDEDYYIFIGELLYNGALDCVFAYPSIVDRYEDIILVPYPLLWGVKGKCFFVLDSGYNKYAPQMHTIDDFIDCCWDKISNVKLK